MKINKRYILAAMLSLATLSLVAQGWFVGVQGGAPFGFSTFSSFGADKPRIGYSAGLYGGYSFNPVLSLEATAKTGQINLSAQDCCIERNLWLGSDGIRYNAPVLDMNGWDYSNLKSSVFMQHYGLQLNVNILGFFNKTKHSRWTLEVSPLVAAVGTKATVKTISGDAEVSKGSVRWHVGAGANLQAGYRLTRHLNIGLYTGLTWLSADRIDGIPEFRHKNNYVWESGIKIGLKFGKAKKQAVAESSGTTESSGSTESSEPAPTTPITPITPITPTAPAESPELPEDPEDPAQTAAQTAAQTTAQTAAQASAALPAIYFAFNSIAIPDSEMPKLEEIKAQMLANPELKITLSGWCDKYGTKAVNARISLQRAEAVKAWLVAQGISADRITAQGNGSDFNEPKASKARRVESVTIITE